ncbi:MAG: NAD-dependent epimerase/dehydratase family protein [bacterium]
MRVLILGLGYTGRELAERLDESHDVIATVTNKDKTDRGDVKWPVEQFQLENPDTIQTLLDKQGWLEGPPISLVFTAGPPRLDNNEDSLALLENFLESLPLERLRSFIYLSSTSVYGDRDGNWVDETAQLDPVSRSGNLKMNCERLLDSKLPHSTANVIVRPGGIYGPGRNSARRYLSDDYELVGEGSKWVNRIHVVDLARIIVEVLPLTQDETLNAVDNNPVRLRKLLKFLYEKTGRDFEDLTRISWDEAERKYSEMKLGLLKPSKRVSSRQLIEQYNFEFEYPDVYSGLNALMESEE